MILENSDIKLVIVSYNCKDKTKQCVESIIETAPFVRICIVDNCSSDGTQEMLKNEFPSVQLIENIENLGYSKAINIGAANSSEKYLILSNADVVYHDNSIQLLINRLHYNHNIGLVAPKQLFLNDKPQQSSGYLPGIKLSIINFLLIHPILNRISTTFGATHDYLDGAVLAVRTEQFKALGGFDESFFFYSEDAEFSKRMIDSGLQIKVVPEAIVTHYRGASTNINGINTDAMAQFVNAKIRLSHLCNSKFVTRFYVLSEIYSTKLFAIVHKALSRIRNKNEFKSKYYSILSEQWAKSFRTL